MRAAVPLSEVTNKKEFGNDQSNKTVASSPPLFFSDQNITGVRGNNKHGTFTTSALDKLDPLETLAEEWTDGTPTSTGWHPRVRIVKTSFKSGLLRIEENVEVKIESGDVKVVRTLIEAAMDAKHVLVSSNHVKLLNSHGIATEHGRNSNYVRVLTENPGLVSSVPTLLQRLKDLGLKEIEPDSIIGACALPSDPVIGNGLAWHLDNLGLLPGHVAGADVEASAAWGTKTDASSILIAVIDSGIASSDLELAPSIYSFPGETLGDGVDNDSNGYIDDVLGYDFYHNDSNAEDEAGHGSMCAALIGATGNNGFGSSGVAWKSSMLNCKFMDHNGLGTLSDAIDAIDYARVAGARILNLSWSYDGDAALLTEALARCDTAGIIMVCASGNAGWAAPVQAPASIRLSHLVVVAASTPSDTLASFSVVDPSYVDLAAPGVDLPVALFNQPWNSGADVTYASGTSFSAAIVSGSLALGLAVFPQESSEQVIRRMLESVDPIPGGAAALASGGRLNLAGMLGNQGTLVPHDSFAQRLVLTDASGQWTGRNNGASTETVDANLALTPTPQRSIWFEWTAATEGLLRVSARAENESEVRLAVFSNMNGLPAELVGQSSDGRAVEIPVAAGQKLLWMIDSSVQISQGLTLSWQLPPSNDNWQAAVLTAGLPLTISGNSLGATTESFEISQPHHSWLPQGSVWWKWTPGVSGNVSVAPTAGHVAFVLPLRNGAPDFVPDYEYSGVILRNYDVLANQSYAILVIPQTPAAAGPFSVAFIGLEDIAILTHPSNTATLAGESVKLEVQFASARYPAFQWFKEGVRIPFATGPTLELNPVTDRSFGSYYVTVASSTSTLQSQTAIISPRHEKPRLIAQTPPRSVITGQSVNLRATFRSASGMTYVWHKNGNVIPGAVSSTFIITSSSLTDAGTYSLTASNLAGPTTTSFQVNISETPWKGWVNRTPATSGRGAIQNVELIGNNANAFTATEWLRSSDGGQSWSTTPLPPSFVASTAATDSSGTALVSGCSFSSYGYLTFENWKFITSSGWQKIQPLLNQSDGTTVAIDELLNLTFFDGEWWALFYSNHARRAIHSTNGINWTALTDPSNSSLLIQATGMFRYEDRLAILYRIPSSNQTFQLRSPGGGVKILDFPDQSVSNIARIGDVCYHPYYSSTLKILDSQATATTFPIGNLFNSSAMFEGTREGDLFSGLEIETNTTAIGSGKFRQGVHEQTAGVKSIGFSCFAKSGNRWLVGYPDGKLWCGSDLRELPLWKSNTNNMNSDLKAYHNEFLCGNYHSSDGSNWQILGAANEITNVVRPLGHAGNKFLHSIRENGYSLPTRKFMSESIYPSALGSSDETDFQSYLWSGENGLLRTDNSSSGRIFQIITDQTPGLLIENVNPGVIWRFVNSAKQINGRWFVSGTLENGGQPFLVTSANGKDWLPSPLPAACVLGKKDNVLIAIENSTRGYSSTTGTSWTPFTPQGLPVLNQINQPAIPTAIVAYRGYYVAQYGQTLYSSADGISWALSSAPLPISYLEENRHTLLAMTTSGVILQPGGETDSGPAVVLPESQQSVTVSRHQGFKYEITAEDPDGDLVDVACLLDGVSITSLTEAPFVFFVNPDAPGAHAVEFVARDQAGRISRVTSKLTVLQGGVTQATSLIIDSNLSKAIRFKGDYYRIYADMLNAQAVVCIWEGDNRWRPVSPADLVPVAMVANAEALVVSTKSGILTTTDGLNWTHLGGFDTTNQTAPILREKDGMICLTDYKMDWISRDGRFWTPSSSSAPPYSTITLEKAAWADSDYGLSNSLSYGSRITYDGGRTWTTLPGTVRSGGVIPVKNGFLILSSDGIYRILRGEIAFTRIEQSTNLYASKVGDLVFTGKVGSYLRTTTDGINFTNHSPPPNESTVYLLRFGGEWIAASSEMICATKDLKTWRVLFDFRSFGFTTTDLATTEFKITSYGSDRILFEHPRLPKRFVMNPDLSIDQISMDTGTGISVPNGQVGGLRFKNRIICLSSWYHTQASDDAIWEKAPLYPSEGLLPNNYLPSVWPTTYFSTFAPTKCFAATDQRFVTFKSDSFNVQFNYVVTSDDGRSFTAHSWTGPIPLPEVTKLAASPDLFLASATNGRVLRSTDGLQWTVHQVSASLGITSILYYNGKWHAAGKQGTQAEVWTSSDGMSWSRTSNMAGSDSYMTETNRPAFIAQGTARMYAGSFGWLRSDNGSSWQFDSILNQSISANKFEPQGEHAQGIIGSGSSGDIVFADGSTGNIIRRINTGAAKVRWLGSVPYLSSLGRFAEWSETDPRFTGITCGSGVFGVGDNLEIQLSIAELADTSTRLQLFLSIDQKLGNDDDVILASPSWSDGALLPGGIRRFTVPLPPSLTPGRFKVGARLILPSGLSDIAIENNQILTESNSVEVPGYELRLTTIGKGNVNTGDPRVLYPQGARLQLQAIPQNGYTFRGWEGSLVSSESTISVLMNADKQLSLTFTPGHRAIVKTIGHGRISGAPSVSVMLPGESIHLSQIPEQGWKAAGWVVDGIPQHEAILSVQPASDTVIEGIFVPDFEILRSRAFVNAPPGANTSWDADPDGDGLNNWQEILLSSNPVIAKSIGQQVERKPDQIRLVFTRPQSQDNAPWIKAEFSENLSTWDAADSQRLVERILENKNGIETVEVTVPIHTGSNGFMRLQMKGSPPIP